MPAGGGTPISDYPSYVSGPYIQFMTGYSPSDWPVDTAATLAFYPYNMMDILRSTFESGNPYETAYAYDPAEQLEATQTYFETATEVVRGLDPVADWTAYANAAIAVMPDVIQTETSIEAEVTAYREDAKPAYQQALNVFLGSMVDFNAIGGSAPIFGIALMRSRFESDVNSTRAKFLSNSNKERALFVLQASSDMLRELSLKVSAEQGNAQLQGELNRVSIVAQKEWLEQELSYEVERLYWDPGLLKFAGQGLSSISGVGMSERGLSRTASAISGAITAGSQLAALGAQAGMGPAVALGTLGALLGGYGGWSTV